MKKVLLFMLFHHVIYDSSGCAVQEDKPIVTYGGKLLAYHNDMQSGRNNNHYHNSRKGRQGGLILTSNSILETAMDVYVIISASGEQGQGDSGQR